MNCIDCDKAMTKNRCTCGGTWLSEAKLVEMAQDIKGSMVALPWEKRDGKSRACPECKTEMLTVRLGSVDLDRCTAHGIWFDADELQRVLHDASMFPDRGPEVTFGPVGSVDPKHYASRDAGGTSGWWVLGALGDLV
jgi:Zn-finger nucleic acid-binding protein